jgi:fatty-acyl-CoA synthase
MRCTADWLGRRASYTPDRIALIVEPGGERYTYRQLDDRANRTARTLAMLGVGGGDRVAILAYNSVVHLDLLWACAKLGAIYVPLNWRLNQAELLPQVADSEPKLLVYGPDQAAAAAAIGAALGTPLVALEEFATRTAAVDAPSPWPATPVDEHTPWMILFTGGTTGRAKGAVLTHGSVAANAFNTILGWQMAPDDVVPILTPFFHTGGLNVFTTPLTYLGATLVVWTSPSFDAGTALELVEKHRATVLFLVPTMFQMIANHPKFPTTNLDSIRFFISGGAPCPRPVMEAFWARGKVFKQGYGLTEAGPNNFVMPEGRYREKPFSVGVPLLNVQARLVDDQGHDVGPDEVGELWLAGPHVFAGYWRNEQATAAAVVDGWLRTGDLARRDAEGFYYIVDRKKDMFISGGENVYPVEIEAVLYQHPKVAECAVVGVPDETWGEVGKAVIALKPGAAPTDEHTRAALTAELLAFCRSRLARYKVPKYVEFRAELPKSGAGKILRRALRGGQHTCV